MTIMYSSHQLKTFKQKSKEGVLKIVYFILIMEKHIPLKLINE